MDIKTMSEVAEDVFFRGDRGLVELEREDWSFPVSSNGCHSKYIQSIKKEKRQHLGCSSLAVIIGESLIVG